PIDPAKLVRSLRQHIERSQGRTLPVAPVADEVRKAAAPVPPSAAHAPAPELDGWPRLAGINLQEVQQRLGSHRDLYVRLVDRLLQEADELLDQARAAAQQGEQAAVKAHLHKLRGQTGNIGATQIAQMLAELEDEADQGRFQVDALRPVEHAFAALKADWAGSAARAAATTSTGTATGTAPDHGSTAPAEEAAPPLDLQRLHVLIDLLAHRRFTAMALYQQLQPSLHHALPASAWAELERAMHGMDFAAARAVLTPLQPADPR
ncbi:MAG: hypothetical protein RJA44_2089, partial [Pseudomonadota bacterium]